MPSVAAVIVDTEKGVAGSGWGPLKELSSGDDAGKVVAPGCASRAEPEPVRSPKITSVFWKHKETKRKSISHTLMDICHLTNAELKPKFQKYEGRVIRRGDNVKDNSGAYAVWDQETSLHHSARRDAVWPSG